MRDVIKIETERLILRPLRLADAARVAAFTADPAVARMVTSIPHPQMEVAAEGFILINLARASLGREFVFAIELRGEGLIGLTGLHAKQGDSFELGYWIGRPYWGQGYATEAATALRDFGFHTLGLARLVSLIAPENKASEQVARMVGLAFEAETVRPNGTTLRVYARAATTPTG